MNVYIIKSQGEEDWACHDGDILGAIKFYVKESDCLLEDIDDISILPEKEWKTRVFKTEEGETLTIEGYMKNQKYNAIIASTAY